MNCRYVRGQAFRDDGCEVEPSDGDCLRKKCRPILSKDCQQIAQQKAILIFSAQSWQKVAISISISILIFMATKFKENSGFDVVASSFFCFDVVYSYIAPVLYDMHAAGC